MEKGCGSTIWHTYKSKVRGKPELELSGGEADTLGNLAALLDDQADSRGAESD